MKKLFLTLAFIMLSVFAAFADSPLTSTDFYKAYLDVPVVKKASLANGVISQEMMYYLENDDHPLGVRLAVVNALGFKRGGGKNVGEYLSYYCEQMGGNLMQVMPILSDAQSIIIGYMAALSDLNDTEFAMGFAQQAHNNNIQNEYPSAALEIIYNLILGQNNPKTAATEIYKWIGNDAVEVQHELNEKAEAIIWDYMKLYYTPQASIWIISKSKNPYAVTINGEYLGQTDSYEHYEFKCNPGYYHLEAKQVSGYAFYPTVNRADINVESTDDHFEFIIGVE